MKFEINPNPPQPGKRWIWAEKRGTFFFIGGFPPTLETHNNDNHLVKLDAHKTKRVCSEFQIHNGCCANGQRYSAARVRGLERREGLQGRGHSVRGHSEEPGACWALLFGSCSSCMLFQNGCDWLCKGLHANDFYRSVTTVRSPRMSASRPRTL